MATKNKKRKPAHGRIAYAIYEKDGAGAVYVYANKNGIPYHPCVPCEAETPTYKGDCLICGTHNKKISATALDRFLENADMPQN